MKPQQIRESVGERTSLALNVPLKKPRNALKYCEFPPWRPGPKTSRACLGGSRRVSISIAEGQPWDQGDTLPRHGGRWGHRPYLPLSQSGKVRLGPAGTGK